MRGLGFDAMKLAVVMGAGLSGKAAKDLLEDEGWNVTVLDGAAPWPEGDFSLAVASPGVPLDHPWQVAARERGVKVISELELGWRRWRTIGRTLAVTGSKGKSSVVKLIASAMAMTGRMDAVACGNYGVPLSEVALRFRPRDGFEPWAVVEVSSFQMETTGFFHPDAAACLNLQEDHLDRHGSVEKYHALKLKLLDMAKMRVEADPSWDAEISGSYFDNDILRPNAEMACALLAAAGLTRAEVRAGLAGFTPLPHRFETVLSRDGVTYIDDSKATSLAALAAGVKMAVSRGFGGCIRLIAGGLEKGDSPKDVISCLQSGVKKVYLIGHCANQLFGAWSAAVPCEVCGTLDRAVESARREARAGDAVLLSPGTASFDQFKSYGARGDAFAAYAKEEKR